MAKLLRPDAVAEALVKYQNQTADETDFKVILLAAAQYAAGSIEWGMELTEYPGLVASTSNDMLINTLSAGNPELTVYARVAPKWQEER